MPTIAASSNAKRPLDAIDNEPESVLVKQRKTDSCGWTTSRRSTIMLPRGTTQFPNATMDAAPKHVLKTVWIIGVLDKASLVRERCAFLGWPIVTQFSSNIDFLVTGSSTSLEMERFAAKNCMQCVTETTLLYILEREIATRQKATINRGAEWCDGGSTKISVTAPYAENAATDFLSMLPTEEDRDLQVVCLGTLSTFIHQIRQWPQTPSSSNVSFQGPNTSKPIFVPALIKYQFDRPGTSRRDLEPCDARMELRIEVPGALKSKETYTTIGVTDRRTASIFVHASKARKVWLLAYVSQAPSDACQSPLLQLFVTVRRRDAADLNRHLVTCGVVLDHVPSDYPNDYPPYEPVQAHAESDRGVLERARGLTESDFVTLASRSWKDIFANTLDEEEVPSLPSTDAVKSMDTRGAFSASEFPTPSLSEASKVSMSSAHIDVTISSPTELGGNTALDSSPKEECIPIAVLLGVSLQANRVGRQILWDTVFRRKLTKETSRINVTLVPELGNIEGNFFGVSFRVIYSRSTELCLGSDGESPLGKEESEDIGTLNFPDLGYLRPLCAKELLGVSLYASLDLRRYAIHGADFLPVEVTVISPTSHAEWVKKYLQLLSPSSRIDFRFPFDSNDSASKQSNGSVKQSMPSETSYAPPIHRNANIQTESGDVITESTQTIWESRIKDAELRVEASEAVLEETRKDLTYWKNRALSASAEPELSERKRVGVPNEERRRKITELQAKIATFHNRER